MTTRIPWMEAAALLLAAFGLAGCAQAPVLVPANGRAFDFQRDTFAFANEVEWSYYVDPMHGITEPVNRRPEADYSQRCFVLSRSARQFFQFAEFDARAPRLDWDGYRDAVRSIVRRDPGRTSDKGRIRIPGYASLRAFSSDWGELLRQELGSAAQSYLQRGNWRMVFPFSREHQAQTAEMLAQEVAVNRPPVVHMATFPELDINHAVLLYAVRETADALHFLAYDPNDPGGATPLVYDRRARHFRFPTTTYFAGGAVDVYEIYRSLLY